MNFHSFPRKIDYYLSHHLILHGSKPQTRLIFQSCYQTILNTIFHYVAHVVSQKQLVCVRGCIPIYRGNLSVFVCSARLETTALRYMDFRARMILSFHSIIVFMSRISSYHCVDSTQGIISLGDLSLGSDDSHRVEEYYKLSINNASFFIFFSFFLSFVERKRLNRFINVRQRGDIFSSIDFKSL